MTYSVFRLLPSVALLAAPYVPPSPAGESPPPLQGRGGLPGPGAGGCSPRRPLIELPAPADAVPLTRMVQFVQIPFASGIVPFAFSRPSPCSLHPTSPNLAAPYAPGSGGCSTTGVVRLSFRTTSEDASVQTSSDEVWTEMDFDLLAAAAEVSASNGDHVGKRFHVYHDEEGQRELKCFVRRLDGEF